MGHPRAYAGYSLHTRRRSFLYFIYAPLRQIAGMGWCCMVGCSWVFLSGVFGAYRLGWDVVKWPGEKGERVVRLRSPKEAGINV